MFFVLGQAEVVFDLLVVDPEHRSGTGHARLGRQLKQPLDGRDGYHLGTGAGVTTGRLVTDNAHSVACGGVDRLDAPVEQHRQFAEAVNVRLIAGYIRHAYQPHQGPHGHDPDGDKRDGQLFHAAAFRFLLKASR